MGKAGVTGFGGLAGSHGQAKMKHLLGSPGTWLGKWEDGMKKTAADHKLAPCALALK